MKTKVLLLSLLSGLLAGGYPVVMSVQAEQPVQLAQVQWQAFSSKEGGFTVLMPAVPSQKTTSVGGELLSLDSHTFKASLENDSVTYYVSYADLPSEVTQLPIELVLDQLVSSIASQRNIKLLSNQNISLGSYPGKEMRIEDPGKSAIRHRIYLVKQRLYQVSTEIPLSKEQVLSADTEKFLNSFQLLK